VPKRLRGKKDWDGGSYVLVSTVKPTAALWRFTGIQKEILNWRTLHSR